MKLITFATFEEAEKTLQVFDARPISQGIYQFDYGLIAICGIGSFVSHIVTTALSDQASSILNIGLAGSLNLDVAIGTIHPVARCQKYLWHPKGSISAEKGVPLPEIQLQDEGLRLCTLDFPLHERKEEFLQKYDLVDMEGYAHAFAGHALGIPCQLFKLVSDHCSNMTSSQIKDKLGLFSEQMADFLKTRILN